MISAETREQPSAASHLTVTVAASNSLLVMLQNSRLFSQDFQFKFAWDADKETVVDGTERIVFSPPIYSDVPVEMRTLSPSLLQVLRMLGIEALEHDGKEVPAILGDPLGMGVPVRFRLLDAEAITLPRGDKRSLSVRFSVMPYNGKILNLSTCSLDRKIFAPIDHVPAADTLCAVDTRRIAKFMSVFGYPPPDIPTLCYLPEPQSDDGKIRMSLAVPHGTEGIDDGKSPKICVVWDPLSDECEIDYNESHMKKFLDTSKLAMLMQKMESPGWEDRFGPSSISDSSRHYHKGENQ